MPNILVVDDEEAITKMIVRIMEGCGHRTTVAGDGEQALACVGRERPDLIILDINLPRMTGFEVCRRLKGDNATRDIPIVMLTAAYSEIEDAMRGVGLGADEYMVKPFLRDVLVHNVERYLAPNRDHSKNDE